jgi:hypothetical protein
VNSSRRGAIGRDILRVILAMYMRRGFAGEPVNRDLTSYDLESRQGRSVKRARYARESSEIFIPRAKFCS